MKELAEPAIEALKSGGLRFNRERFAKIYLHWLENIRDWCISRQLWWGHRLPVYYCACGHITVSKTEPEACAGCGSKNIMRDEDTLDTWFSSALWPFSTLGWPAETDEMKYFYPTDVLVTAQEIIFFWVVRMVFSSLKFTGKIPFKDVFINGTVTDAFGKKMSKSKGNGLDPLEVVEKYGADALRLTLVSGNAVDSDMRFYWERMDFCRNFLNKLWNASRFALMNMDGEGSRENLQTEDRWILSLLNSLVKDVTEKINSYDLGLAAQKIIDFIWDEFCDWYVEMIKPRLFDKNDSNGSRGAALWTLKKVLITSVKLLHPFTPFVTETLFQTLQDEEKSVMVSAWPEFDAGSADAEAEKEIELIKEAVRGVRAVRKDKEVPPSLKIKIIMLPSDEKTSALLGRGRAAVAFLSGANETEILPQGSASPENSVSVMIHGAALYLPLSALVDTEKELARLSKEKQKIQNEIARSESRLSNESFTAKAPEAIISAERENMNKFKTLLDAVDAQLSALGRSKQ